MQEVISNIFSQGHWYYVFLSYSVSFIIIIYTTLSCILEYKKISKLFKEDYFFKQSKDEH